MKSLDVLTIWQWAGRGVHPIYTFETWDITEERMGYYIEQDVERSAFFLPAAQKATALQCLKRLRQNSPNSFHFIDWEQLRGASTLEVALDAANWECALNEGGDVVGLKFTGRKLGGKESEVFHLLAHVGAVGSIYMRGEDDDKWVYVLDDGVMKEVVE